jgi:hypothetical protein
MDLTDAFFSFVIFVFIFWTVLTGVCIAMLGLVRQLNWFRFGE